MSNYAENIIYEITTSLIAILVVGGAVLLSVITSIQRQQATMPPGWLTTAVGAVIGFYFARRSQATERLDYLTRLDATAPKTEV